MVFVPFYPLHTGTVLNQSSTQKIMQKYQITETQLALAWLLNKSKVVLPIPGTLSQKHLDENLKALKIELSSEDMSLLNNLL